MIMQARTNRLIAFCFIGMNFASEIFTNDEVDRRLIEHSPIRIRTDFPVTLTTEQLSQRENKIQQSESRYFYRRRTKVPYDKQPYNSQAPSVTSFPDPSNDVTALTKMADSTLTVKLNFTAMTLVRSITGFLVPPDTRGDVNDEDQIIVALNNVVRSFNKRGIPDGVLNVTLTSFLNDNVADPRIRFDKFSKRWFLVAINGGDQNGLNNKIIIAVSHSNVIKRCTRWDLFSFVFNQVPPIGDANLFFDYPMFGIDKHALYIGGNLFNASAVGGEQYVNSTAFVIQKESLLKGGPAVITVFRDLFTPPFIKGREGDGATGLQGVDNLDSTARFGYFVVNDPNSLSALQLFRVQHPESTAPTLAGPFTVTVPSWAIPLGVPAKGTLYGDDGTIDPLDERLMGAHVRDGQLYTSHTIQVNKFGNSNQTQAFLDRSATRFYQLDLSAGGVERVFTVPTLVQLGTLFDTNQKTNTPRSFFMGSLITTKASAKNNGSLTHALSINCTVAGQKEFARVASAFRLPQDQLGRLRAPVNLTRSNASYNFSPFTRAAPDTFGGGQRWGDYSFTTVDPKNDKTVWTVQMFTRHIDVWGIKVTALLLPKK